MKRAGTREAEARRRRRPTGALKALRWRGPALAAVLLCLAAAQPAAADEVLLTNGDRITGTIEHVRDGKLTLKVPYSKDPVKIDWASVQGLITQAPITVLMPDGSRVQGPAEMTDEGQVRILSTDAGPVVIGEIASIQGINPPPDITYKGDMTAAGGYTTGNTETASANLDAKFVVRSKRQRGTLRGAWNYGTDNGVESTSNASGSLKYDYFFTKRFYGYGNLLLEYDYFQSLALRLTAGGGAGYQFFDTDRFKLSGEFGASYVAEDFFVRVTEYDAWIAGVRNNTKTDADFPVAYDKGYAAGRWSVDLDWKVLPDKINLFHFHEGYFGFEEPENLLLRTRQGMRFTLVKDFYTSVQLNVDFNNQPARPDINKVDTAILFGLGYAFDI